MADNKREVLSKDVFPNYGDANLPRMVNFINEPVLVLSSRGHIEIINNHGATLFGARREELLGESILIYISDTCLTLKKQIISSANYGCAVDLSTAPQEVRLVRKDGSSVAVDLSISLLEKSTDNSDALYLCIIHDLTAHKAEFSVLKEKATTDQLTGLANRHHFAEMLDQHWTSANRESTPLSLILLDIDHFKQVNDTFGHLAGDKCLKRIGETIKLSLPHRDALAARYGGEEFALILPHCNSHTAHLLAIRIKRHIAQLTFKELSTGSVPFLTVSVGVATQVNQRFQNVASFLDAADVLLYRAKSQGRNQICLE
ncbi:sensor domain-containing diguanylate cyclase [Alteromonas sp. C1M14]|uniref:GGDEF domain-containing protein n=1 Tax=Alteromonas sp. C1M14 TaxID=2841567 RepID=UPI001C08E80C|nr:sensor domain-containing diguanylate cyclase [Alteromonas sp. C1M14]MBU2979693.1 sensor domain-containing diguanylate cyclase [Alteromonas sp. C1M14]